jgi:23S rRNA pseudouridine2605 synthase
VRLQKFISRAGIASRRKAEGLILSGRVTVNGDAITELGTRVDPQTDVVTVDGRVAALTAVRWVVFFKPRGLLTTENDPHGGKTIFDVLPSEMAALRYVGRLDRDTEGVLLLTNDGDLAHRVTHPSFQVEREYEVRTRKQLDRGQVVRLLKGVELEDGRARAKRVEHTGSRSVTLVLTEGRNREVRRMMEAVGHAGVDLRRVRYGPVELGTLSVGQWRELEASEIAVLRRLTNVPDKRLEQ